MTQNLLEPLTTTLETVRHRLTQHQQVLSENKTRTRRSLIGDESIRVWSAHAKFSLLIGGEVDMLYLTSANLNKPLGWRILLFSVVAHCPVSTWLWWRTCTQFSRPARHSTPRPWRAGKWPRRLSGRRKCNGIVKKASCFRFRIPDRFERNSGYARQTYYSLMWHDSICNTVQEPTVTSTIVAKKTTTWGESGFPSEFLGKYCSVLRRGTG